MATDNRSLPAFFNVDADFQAWCQGIAAQLVVAGWVKTSDSGQINNATVAKPAAINTAQGYEIYRLNDSLQATAPIFLKIEYGSAAVVDRPSLWITIGTGTNGAGTLTGNTTTRKQAPTGSSKSSGVTLFSYCCGDGSGLALMNNYDPASNSFGIFIIIDRVRDGAGSAVGDGAFVWIAAPSFQWQQPLPQTGAVPAGTAASGSFALSIALCNSNAVGLASYVTNVAVVPMMCFIGRLFFSKFLHFALAATVTNLTPISIQTLGGNHTYMPISVAAVPTGSTDASLMLWE